MNAKTYDNLDESVAASLKSPSLNPEIGRRLREAAAKLTEKEAEEATGKSYRTLERYFAGHDAAASAILGLAKATGVSADWLMFGSDVAPAASRDEFVAVPLLPEAASMGDGRDAEANDSIVDRLVMFRREWVSRLGINPLRAHVLPVVGDSMEPTLLGGDVVLCDTGDQNLGGGGIFVVSTEDGPVVKRLERDDEGVVLVVSDNKRHRVRRVVPPFSDTFRIIGRVRWYARTLR